MHSHRYRACCVVLLLLFVAPASVQAERRLANKMGPEVQGVVAAEDGSFFCVGFYKDTLIRDDREPADPIAKCAGEHDAFVARFSAEGDLLWFVSIGGPQLEEAQDLAITPDGGVVVTGVFQGQVDFDPGDAQVLLEAKPEELQQFVAKFQNDGTLSWAGSVGPRGGGDEDSPDPAAYRWPVTRVRVATDGRVHVLAPLHGKADVDPGEAEQIVDAELTWKSVIVVLDGSGNYVRHGLVREATTFLPMKDGWILGGAATCAEATVTDGFIWRVQEDGQLAWSHRWSGKPMIQYGRSSGGVPEVFDSRCAVQDLARDPKGRIHATGSVQGVVDFDPDQRSKTDTLTSRLGNRLGFVATFHQDGGLLGLIPVDTPTGARSAVKYGMGTQCTSIDVDSSGTIYLAGRCHSLNTFKKRPLAQRTAFVARLKGSRIAWLAEHPADGAQGVCALPGKKGVLFGGAQHWPPRPGKKRKTLVSMGKGAFVAGYTFKGKLLRPAKKK